MNTNRQQRRHPQTTHPRLHLPQESIRKPLQKNVGKPNSKGYKAGKHKVVLGHGD